MASSKEYLAFILEQLSELDEITHRAMMGEFMLYHRGKLFGYLCDDRFLVKPVEAAKRRMPEAAYELPYEGAKPMLLVDKIEDKAFLKTLSRRCTTSCPRPSRKRKRGNRNDLGDRTAHPAPVDGGGCACIVSLCERIGDRPVG